MFFDNFEKLCTQRGISVYKACTEIGLNRSAVAKWKKGTVPNGTTLNKLSEYFGVSVERLLSDEFAETKKEPAPQTGNELDKALEGVDFALYGEVHDLTEGEKRDVLKFVEFLKSKRGE